MSSFRENSNLPFRNVSLNPRLPIKNYKVNRRYKVHHGRYAYYLHTKRLEEALMFADNGYTIYRSPEGGFICEFPEQSVIDLSDVNLPFPYTPEYPIKVYSFLKKNIRSLLSSAKYLFWQITGEALEGQIRIAGESKFALKNFITHLFLKLPHLLPDTGGDPLVQSTPLLKGVFRGEWRSEVHDYLKIIQKKYEQFCLPQYRRFFRVFNCHKAFSHYVWNDVRRIGKEFVFVLQGGLPLALGFIQTTGSFSNVFLVERHRSGDCYSCFRPYPLIKAKFGNYDVKPATLIIDKVYTGNTLREIKEEEPKCTYLGLLPKSCKAFDFLEQIIFNSCLIPVEQVPDTKNWFIELYWLTEEIRRNALKSY